MLLVREAAEAVSSAVRVIPGSVRIELPSGRIMMIDGLMSRWKSPAMFRCAAASAMGTRAEAAEGLLQAFPFTPFSGEPGHAVVFAKSDDADDIRVPQRHYPLCGEFEAFAETGTVRVGEIFGADDLQCGILSGERIDGTVNPACPPVVDKGGEFKLFDLSPGQVFHTHFLFYNYTQDFVLLSADGDYLNVR